LKNKLDSNDSIFIKTGARYPYGRQCCKGMVREKRICEIECKVKGIDPKLKNVLNIDVGANVQINLSTTYLNCKKFCIIASFYTKTVN
jgi:hypothetical protein